MSFIQAWLTWFINIVVAIVGFLFNFDIIENISLGSTFLYFALIGLAVIYINNFFWGKANKE